MLGFSLRDKLFAEAVAAVFNRMAFFLIEDGG